MSKYSRIRSAKNHIGKYEVSEMYSIRHAYNKPSYAKRLAWLHCYAECDRYNGHDLKIISFNTFNFTAGFLYEDSETGVVMFRYISPSFEISVEY